MQTPRDCLKNHSRRNSPNDLTWVSLTPKRMILNKSPVFCSHVDYKDTSLPVSYAVCGYWSVSTEPLLAGNRSLSGSTVSIPHFNMMEHTLLPTT